MGIRARDAPKGGGWRGKLGLALGGGGGIGVEKARVALARKFAVLLHHLWSRAEDFRRAAA